MSDRPDNPRLDVPDDANAATVELGDRAMTHQHLDTDALSAYIDDRLQGDQMATATGHIATCADCSHELAELRATIALLNGLPQYRPRRSFTLGSDYAHPVRTSRLARLLPLFPALRAATVACLLLLVGVGTADILTQIGEDSDGSSRPAAMSSETTGDTAMDPGTDGEIDQASGSGNVPSDDGTGGQSAADPTLSESKPVTTDNADESAQVDESLPEGESESAGAMGGGDTGSRSVASDSGEDAESGSDSAADAELEAPAAAAPVQDAESNSARSADGAVSAANAESIADDTAAGDAADDASAGDAADEAPAADESSASGDADDGVRGAVAPSGPTVPVNATEPAPTVDIASDPTATIEPTQSPIARADTTGSDPQRAGSTADAGISTWRLIEYILAAVLVVLAGLAISLHRLRVRARTIGLIR